jgi:hypothetical protein
VLSSPGSKVTSTTWMAKHPVSDTAVQEVREAFEAVYQDWVGERQVARESLAPAWSL